MKPFFGPYINHKLKIASLEILKQRRSKKQSEIVLFKIQSFFHMHVQSIDMRQLIKLAKRPRAHVRRVEFHAIR